jgi:amidase
MRRRRDSVNREIDAHAPLRRRFALPCGRNRPEDAMTENTLPGVAETARRIADGTLTCEAALAACIARIQERDNTLHAFAHLRAEAARVEARRLDSETPRGALHGIAFGVKDIIDTVDLPTELGSPIHAGRRPTADAAVVALLRAAGGVLLGKTVTTEFAHVHPGPTRNPHDPRRTPGGSSSGSAAAVAAGMVPFALGTQTAGSVIRPAAYCGVVGYKPSYGDINPQGMHDNVRSFDTIGVMVRAVEDLPPVRAGCLGAAPTRLAPPPVSTLRVGLCRTHRRAEADATTMGHLEAAAGALAAAGAQVSEVELAGDTAALDRAIIDVSGYEFARCMAHERFAHADRLSRALLDGRVADGLVCDHAGWRAGLAVLAEHRRRLADRFGDLDLLITPSAPGEAPEGLDKTGPATFNAVWSALHVPAITLPLFRGPAGLPIGLQLVGAVGEDDRLIDAAETVFRTLRR